MKQEDMLKKIKLGYSELTNTVYLFIPDKNGNPKVKVDITEQYLGMIDAVAKLLIERSKDDDN